MSRGDDHWIVDLRSTHMGTFDAPAGWEAVAECVCGWQARRCRGRARMADNPHVESGSRYE